MTEFHPDIAMIMNQKFDHNKEYKFVSEENNLHYTNEAYFLILNLASTLSLIHI